MLIKRIMELKDNVMERSSSYLTIGKDIFDYSKGVIKNHLEATSESQQNKNPTQEEESEQKEKRRELLKKQMMIPDEDNSEIQGRQESMKSSQGVADHSGSSYHGPGKPGEKSNANMWQRNFDNHQGN